MDNLLKFVYVQQSCCLKPWKIGYTIARIIWVPPNTWFILFKDDIDYKKDPTIYDDIKEVDGFVHNFFLEKHVL